MSASGLSRFAVAITVGIAAVGVALPAFADSPVTVSFQANNPWTQEIGSVDRFNDSHDYSVQVGAGKTLQINLVTRDPNVFFKVRDETADQQLVDTFKTGATTWSAPVATATTYVVHVYVDPDAMTRGEVAKYALQIGRYGASDMQVANTEVSFGANQPWAQEVSELNSQAPSHDYSVAIPAGETLQVNLVTQNPNVHFKVKGNAEGQPLVDTAQTGTATWSTPVTTAATYTIEVYADPSAVPPGHDAKYALQVGHYASANASAATPAATGTAPGAAPAPASTAPGAAPAATSTAGTVPAAASTAGG
jgi:hypothetical protein